MKKLWHCHPSGIVVPEGYTSEQSRTSKDTYLDIKEKAIKLESLYLDLGVPIPAKCGLAILIESAKELSDSWLTGGMDNVSKTTLFNTIHLSRVSDAISTLRGDQDIKFHLKQLTDGSLDLLKRKRTVAKDFLWELELLHILRVHGVQAELKEPPDIVANFEGKEIGIACKKVHAKKNFAKTLSQGVNQIERQYEFGIIAVNIDDLIPPEALLIANSQKDMAKKISEHNFEFLRQHERYFRKYLSTGRLLSALVSTSALVELKERDTCYFNARQSSVWMIPGLPEDKRLVFESFYNKIYPR